MARQICKVESLGTYEELRTDVVYNKCKQWTRNDVLKFFTCSLVVLQCIDISNGRILKSFTSLPALYYSYRYFLEDDQLPPQFSSITTPLALYWVLECLATFTTLDMADLLMYIALKICLVEILRWKTNQNEHFLWRHKIRDVSSTRFSVRSPEHIMGSTQTNTSDENATTYRTISKQLNRTICSMKSMDIAMTSACCSPLPHSTVKRPPSTATELESMWSSISCTTQKSSLASVNGFWQDEEECESGDWNEVRSPMTLTSTRSLEDDQESVMTSKSFTPERNGEDLITNPMFKLEFPRYGQRRCKKVTMSNVSRRKIIWTLRSNITDFLSATPTAGVLDAGQHDYVNVIMKDGCVQNGKLAISYVFVDDSVQHFDRNLYEISARIDHSLDVVHR